MPAVSASTRPRGAGSTESSRPSAGLAMLLALLGLGAMATALLGPLAPGWIDYHVSSGAADQLRGGAVAGLVLVGPVALAAAWRVATGRLRADALPSTDTRRAGARTKRTTPKRFVPRGCPASRHGRHPRTPRAPRPFTPHRNDFNKPGWPASET